MGMGWFFVRASYKPLQLVHRSVAKGATRGGHVVYPKHIIRMTVIVCRSGSETVNERRGTRDEMSAIPFEAVSAVAFVILIVLILFLGVLGRIWG
jgi:hypothetical protein